MPYGIITYGPDGAHKLNGQALSKNFHVQYRGNVTTTSAGQTLWPFPTGIYADNGTVVARRVNADGNPMIAHAFYSYSFSGVAFTGAGTYEVLILGDLSSPAVASTYIPPGGFGIKAYNENGGLNFSSDIIPFSIDLVATFYNTNAATNYVSRPSVPAGMHRYYVVEAGTGTAVSHLNSAQMANGIKRITETDSLIYCNIPPTNVRSRPAGVSPNFVLVSGFSPAS